MVCYIYFLITIYIFCVSECVALHYIIYRQHAVHRLKQGAWWERRGEGVPPRSHTLAVKTGTTVRDDVVTGLIMYYYV